MFMNPNFSEWKNFEFGRLIDADGIYKATANNRDDLLEVPPFTENSIRYITRTNENNGCECIVSKDGLDLDDIEEGNAITIGDTTATVFYQDKEFITGDHMIVIRAEWMCKELALFIVSLLNLEKFKYSYGRAYLMDRVKETIIKLPVKRGLDNKPLIDEEHKYSDDGYIPDWEFMKKYILSLHNKPISTGVKRSSIALNSDRWKEFNVDKLFSVGAGVYHYPDEYESGVTPYVTASNQNNGVAEKISLISEYESNRITIGKVKAATFYQNARFCATSDVNILTPRFEMNQFIALFFVTVFNFSENYKWNYGRQCRIGNTKRMIIKLPCKCDDEGNYLIDPDHTYSDDGYIPDFDFMERYIKSLPYSDRL